MYRTKNNIPLKEFLEKKEIISSHRKSGNVVNPVHRSCLSILKAKGFPSSGGKLEKFSKAMLISCGLYYNPQDINVAVQNGISTFS